MVKDKFTDVNDFKVKGGMKNMSDSLGRGVVLVLSIWDDHSVQMKWLDSTYPTDNSKPGCERGPCSTSSGDPDELERDSPNSYVRYSNIKVGEIGSTNPDAYSTFLQ